MLTKTSFGELIDGILVSTHFNFDLMVFSCGLSSESWIFQASMWALEIILAVHFVCGGLDEIPTRSRWLRVSLKAIILQSLVEKESISIEVM